MGYYDCITPPVIQRNILENPGWYTQYTPYQAEIAQGRLEALLNFQTMVADLTGLALANASLLDEGTAAAEAMAHVPRRCERDQRKRFFVADDCHPQTIAVVRTRAAAAGHRGRGRDRRDGGRSAPGRSSASLLQYPTTDGAIVDYAAARRARPRRGRAGRGGRRPARPDAAAPAGRVRRRHRRRLDASASACRSGFGGPHAAFLATRDEYKRQMPGRLVGVSQGRRRAARAYRLALQTREQHIRREKATSNICTAQVLLAVMASMYAVYHGPEGLRAHRRAACTRWPRALAAGLQRLGPRRRRRALLRHAARARCRRGEAAQVMARARAAAAQPARLRRRLARHRPGRDHAGRRTWTRCSRSSRARRRGFDVDELRRPSSRLPGALRAHAARYLTHPVFNRHHSETEMLRYIHRLQARDLSLTTSMIPLGSCTMKLNATTEMLPVTWPEFGELHPFAPADQTKGYARALRRPRGLAGRDHRLRRRVAAAQRRLAGRVRGPARHPRLPREPRRGATATSASSPSPPTAPTPPAR